MTQQCRLQLDCPKDENTSCLSRKLALHWEPAVFSCGCSAMLFPSTWLCWLISCRQTLSINEWWCFCLSMMEDDREFSLGFIPVAVLATEHVTVWGLLDLSFWNVLLDSFIGRLMHCWFSLALSLSLSVCVCVRESELQVLLSLSSECTRCAAEGDGGCYEWRLINEIIR